MAEYLVLDSGTITIAEANSYDRTPTAAPLPLDIISDGTIIDKYILDADYGAVHTSESWQNKKTVAPWGQSSNKYCLYYQTDDTTKRSAAFSGTTLGNYDFSLSWAVQNTSGFGPARWLVLANKNSAYSGMNNENFNLYKIRDGIPGIQSVNWMIAKINYVEINVQIDAESGYALIYKASDGNWRIAGDRNNCFQTVSPIMKFISTDPNPVDPGGGDDPDLPPSENDIPGVDIPNSAGYLSSGLVTLYELTKTQLSDLASFLWSSDAITNLKKIFTDPMDVIISITKFPVGSVSGVPATIIAGNLDTGVSATKVVNQFKQVTFGSFSITKQYNSFLDYSPHTSIEIWLPYIGFQSLDPSIYMGKTFTPVYNIDLLTGDIVCYIKVDNNYFNMFRGNMATPIPITSADRTAFWQGIITTGIQIFATGGMSTGSAIMAGASLGMQSLQPDYQIKGGFGNSAGQMGPQQPFVIISRPKASQPENYGFFNGIPSDKYGILGSFSGFTVCASAHVEGITATQEEKQQIEQLLKGGILL